MSELIDRKELLKCFCITKDGRRIPEVDCDNHEITISIKDIKRIIREQPTVDTRKPMSNIVEKLKESQERYDDVAFMEMNANGHTLDFEYSHGKKDGVQEAINIVKQEINKEN